MVKIISTKGREILDSSGNPTIEAEIQLASGAIGIASVPAGASTGSREAFELRDHDLSRFAGLGVLKAVENINSEIRQTIVNHKFTFQSQFDQILLELDGSVDKSQLGANAILAVSLAFAKAVAKAKNIPLYQYFMVEMSNRDGWPSVSTDRMKLPRPMMVLIEGGKHATNSTDFQEYLVKIDDIPSTVKQIQAGQEIRMKLAEILKSQGYSTNVGFEGAFALNEISNNEKPLEFIKMAIENAGYNFSQISIGLDVAASELWQNDQYYLSTMDSYYKSEKMINYLVELKSKYPISSIEDGLGEQDSSNWSKLKNSLEETVLIGDDLTVTNPKLINQYAENGSISGVIIKMNQIGTISETLAAAAAARQQNLEIIISHRGSETMETALVDLAIAVGADYIKVGPTRGERVEKYNHLLRIAEKLGL